MMADLVASGGGEEGATGHVPVMLNEVLGVFDAQRVVKVSCNLLAHLFPHSVHFVGELFHLRNVGVVAEVFKDLQESL